MPDIAYYPAKRYVDKNLKPERALKPYDFAAIVMAQKRAVNEGVLTPELAKYLLPMAITEGRSGNYGIRNNLSVYAKPETIERYRKMGLSIADATGDKPVPDTADMVIVNRGKDKHLELTTDDNGYNPAKYSRVMAATLAEKASLIDVKTPEDAVKRYNGKGRALEVADGKVQQADVNTYLSKVKEAQEMLEHPANTPLADYLNSLGVQE